MHTRILRLVLIITLFAAGSVAVARATKSNAVISPLADTFTLSTPAEATRRPLLGFLSKPKKPDDLRAAVKTIADAKWKNYSVLVVDRTSNFRMAINETAMYDAASVNKIPILVSLYHEADQDRVDFSKTITLQAKDIQNYGTGSIRYDEPGTVYSVKTLARLMIQKSDNTAAYILANYVLTLKGIQSYIESLGTTQTDMIENTTSNRDIALLFEKMFDGKVANPARTEEMIGFLKDTDFEERLPAKLPDEAAVYHKIGTGVGAVHDAGVVESPKTTYYIGIFTSNITDEEQTSEEVAQVSKIVYDFMR